MIEKQKKFTLASLVLVAAMLVLVIVLDQVIQPTDSMSMLLKVLQKVTFHRETGLERAAGYAVAAAPHRGDLLAQRHLLARPSVVSLRVVAVAAEDEHVVETVRGSVLGGALRR